MGRKLRDRESLSIRLTDEQGVDFTQNRAREDKRESLLLKNIPHRLSKPLTKITPPAGWGVTIHIEGKNLAVFGSTAYEVAVRVKELYLKNAVEMPDDQLWFNLNLIWLGRTPVRNSLITEKALRALGMNEPESDNAPLPDGRTQRHLYNVENFDPIDVVGPKAWGMLQVYLALEDEEYDVGQFEALVDFVEDIVNDSNVGCAECAGHFKQRLEKVAVDQWETRDKARRWVFKTMNDIRKSNNQYVLTWEQAKKINYWK